MDKIDYYKKYEPIFGSWYIKKAIGKGSFGHVYEIEQPSTGFKSAMKAITIPSDVDQIREYRNLGMDDASITAYFRAAKDDLVNEFRMMEQMKGETNIVSYADQLVIPHGDGIGWDILVRMELLTDLTVYVNKNGLSLRNLIKLGTDMCNALDICNEYNIVHRDIKPANIFISNRGRFKLGDFGIAKTIEKTTGGLSKKGTYHFMAPEVYNGNDYGRSVDLYAVGLVLYYHANKRRTPFLPPFPEAYGPSNDETAFIRRIKGDDIPPLDSIPAELSDIILKACAFDPEARFKTPGEMRSALNNCYDSLLKSGIDMDINLCPNAKEIKSGTYNSTNTMLVSRRGLSNKGAAIIEEQEKKRRAEEQRKKAIEKTYSDALQILSMATTEADYKQAAGMFDSISGYKDVAALLRRCNDGISRIQTESGKAEEKTDMAEKKTGRASSAKKYLIICAAILVIALGALGIYKSSVVPSYDFPALSSQIVLSSGQSFDAYDNCSAPSEEYDSFTLTTDNESVVGVSGSTVTANKEGVATLTLTQDFGGKKVKTSEHLIVVLNRDKDYSNCEFSSNSDGSYKIIGSDFSGTLYCAEGYVFISDDSYEITAKEKKLINHYAESKGVSADGMTLAKNAKGNKYIVRFDAADGCYKAKNIDKVNLSYGEWSDWVSELPDGVKDGVDYEVETSYRRSDRLMSSDTFYAQGCDSESEAISNAESMLPQGASANSINTYQDEDGLWNAEISYSYYSDSWSEWTESSSGGSDTSTTRYKTLYRYRTII